ncbi:MAG TPA: hypothetical protein DHU65_04070 [Clostridiales bacterium]|nr:hypothetical protein [Clostridiales bacterium]
MIIRLIKTNRVSVKELRENDFIFTYKLNCFYAKTGFNTNSPAMIKNTAMKSATLLMKVVTSYFI